MSALHYGCNIYQGDGGFFCQPWIDDANGRRDVLTSTGPFVSRDEAAEVAEKLNAQIADVLAEELRLMKKRLLP